MRTYLKDSNSKKIYIYMVDSTDHATPETGATVAVKVSKNGGAFGAGGGSVAELEEGVYAYTPSAGDVDTLGPIAFKATASGCDPFIIEGVIVAYDPYEAVRMGLTSLPNATPGSNGGLPTTNGTKVNQTVDLTAGQSIACSDKTGFALTSAYDAAKNDVLTPLAVVDGLIDTLISRLTETRAGYLDAAISSRGTLTAAQVRTELATELARILTALPNAAPNAAGGLIISTAGDLDADMLALTANSISERLPASLTVNGNMKSSIVEIIATTLTETAGQIAAAFKKFFDIGTPTGTINSLPAAIPGSNGGLPTTNGSKLNQTADLTAGQSVGISGDLSATMKTSVQAAADAAVTANTKIGAIEAKTANIPASPAAVGSEMALADGAITASKIAAAALSGKGDWNTVAPDNTSIALLVKLCQADVKLDTTTAPWTEKYYEAGTATLLLTKVLYDENGDGISSIDSYIGQRMSL